MENNEQLAWYVVPAIIAAAILIMGVLLEFGARRNNAIKKLEEVLKTGAFLSPTVLSIAIGVLLIFGGIENYLFTPGLALDDSTLNIVLRYGEMVIGILMIIGVFTRMMMVGVIALFVTAFFVFPALKVIDYSVFVGVAVYLFLIHRDALSFSFFFHPLGKHELFDQYRKYALPILRFVAGASLAFVAFHHNILDPGPAVSFVEGKPLLNFMQSAFGIESFTNEILVFQTGVFGILGGILLAFGILERIVSTIIGVGLLLTVFIMGPSYLPIIIPYFALIYIIITGNQFEAREQTETA